MKKAYLKELQARLLGGVTDSDEVREHFATDASIFRVMPEAVVYPKNTADVRKVVGYLAERAEAGKPPLGITARGHGTDLGGGALGEGLQMVFPAHLNRLVRLGKDTVTVQPGMLYQTLQQALQSHGRFLPPAPASAGFSTIGGAVGNDAASERSLKYGSTHRFVRALKVVLADGSLVEARRISARELNRRKGQTNLEGEIYRKLDSLILDHEDIIAKAQPRTTKNTAGYALGRVRGKDGSFDLAQIITGSQGTLGLVTEITLETRPWTERATLVVGYFDEVARAGEAITKLTALAPSTLELVDRSLLEYVRRHRPQDIAGLVPERLPRLVLLVEFNDPSQFSQTLRARRARRILAKYATSQRSATDPIEQEALWNLRRAASALLWMINGSKKALPFIDDGAVPVAKLPQFLDRTSKLLEQHDLEAAIWGHAGDGNLHVQPFLDLAKKKDTDKLFALTRDYHDLISSLGGSISGRYNDGLIRAPFLEQYYGPEMTKLFRHVKQIFDPHNLFNPGQKTGATLEYARSHLRHSYSLAHLYDHSPYN